MKKKAMKKDDGTVGGRTSESFKFVEQYYPNFSSSDEIALNEDLCKLLDEEYSDGDSAEKLLAMQYNGDNDNPNIQADFNESLIKIYEAAILNFLSMKKKM